MKVWIILIYSKNEPGFSYVDKVFESLSDASVYAESLKDNDLVSAVEIVKREVER